MTKLTPQQFIYVEQRTCHKCKQIKNRKEFHKDSYDKFGLQAKCKWCTNQKNDEYRNTHREYFKLKNKEKYNKEENPARYIKHREAYLKRRHDYQSSIRGRFYNLLDSAKRRSKNKLEFNLDIEWLLDIYNNQNGKCLLTGLELDFITRPVKGARYAPLSPSLDRINPSLGYTKDNVRLVCTAINIALNSFGEDFFEEIARAFIERKSSGNPTSQ